MPSRELSLSGMWLGIGGVLLAVVPVVGFLSSLAAVVLSGVALRRCGRGEQSGRGAATAGVVLGVLGLVTGVALVTYIMTRTMEPL